MKVALVQMHPKLGDKRANLEFMKERISQTDADLVVFPELSLTGYLIRDEVKRLAEPIDGESVSVVKMMAEEHGRHVIFGMAERGADPRGLMYNAAVLVHPDGNVDSFRKFHVVNFGPFEEYTYFAPGDKAGVFDTKLGRIGVQICYDIFFPELAKLYAMRGADVIVNISASPSATRPFFENIMLSRAIENTVFFLYTNLVGTELNMVFWGGATAVGPRGDILAKGPLFEERVVEAELDMRSLDIARENRPTIRDTRPELFEAIHELVEERRP